MAEMTPIDWAKRPIQKYADFSGRAPRAEFWWFVLALIIAYVVVSIVENILGMSGMIAGAYGPLTLILMLGTLIPQISVSVRRLHDTNRTGWWLLLPIIPYCIGFALAGPAMMGGGDMTGMGLASIFLVIGFVGAIVLLVFYVLPGTQGDNRFGSDPYAGAVAAA
jgi:uncharacterized membrane protein YhaH (DUF805 family)